MNEKRGSWYLITGLIFGILVGVLFAWLVSPVHYVNTSPASMRTEFKDHYRSLIALAYIADGDLGRARVRLALLKDADSVQALAAQAQRLIAEGGATTEARSLALLAAALGKQLSNTGVTPVGETPANTLTAPVVSLSPTSQPVASPTPTPTPLPPTITLTSTRILTLTPGLTQIMLTLTPFPTFTDTSPSSTQTTATGTSATRQTASPSPTPTATPGRPFVVKDRSQVCDPTRGKPLLQVQLDDAANQPVPGVEIGVTWLGGEDSFFTGLKPDVSLGYADFVMMPQVVYTMRINDGGQPVTQITPPQCTDQGGQVYWGGWSFQLVQP